MDDIRRWWIAGTSAALLSVNTAQAHPVPYDMLVRIYNIARLPRADIAAAQRAAEKIFRRAGIELRWRACPGVNDGAAIADDVCMERLQPREMIGRLVTGGHLSSGRVFGQAVVIDGTHTSTMATIFVDRISITASRLSIDGGTLLGRTLAHELGHLLLGNNSHASYGLMRGTWSAAVMRSDTGYEWNFSNREAQQMRLALVLRTEGTPGRRQLQAVGVPRGTDPS
jgi:hypothetical protein